jgi:sugar phosphate isomerase/epimerase
MDAAFSPLLGLKLPLDWRGQQSIGALPGFAGDLYAFLHDLGLRCIEFGVGLCQPDEIDLIAFEAAACGRHDLSVALHPYLPGPWNPAQFGRSQEADAVIAALYEGASTAADGSGQNVVVNLHPAEAVYDAPHVDLAACRRELLSRSQAFLAAVRSRLQVLGDRVTVVVEHQVPPGQDEPVIRIGDRYQELLEAVGTSGLSLCWDIGHSLLSAERYGQSRMPPEEFLRRVRYVHLHDVVAGCDHRVVRADSGDVHMCINVLADGGFDGGITLEYAADAVIGGGGPQKVITESVAVLAEWGVSLP